MAGHRNELHGARTDRARPTHADSASKPQRARPVDSCSMHPHELRPEQRTAESLRAEQAWSDLEKTPPSRRPMAAPRASHAAALFETLRAFDVSARRLALMLDVSDRLVRKWLGGAKPVPTSAVSALPVDMALDFLDRLRALVGPGPSGMDREIERLRRMRDLEGALEAQRRIGELVGELAMEARR